MLASKVTYLLLSVLCSSANGALDHRSENKNLSKSPKFLQVQNREPGLMSLLFHGKITPRALDIGIEDNNEGLKDQIMKNEEYDELSRALGALEETELFELKSLYKAFGVQNIQLDRISNFINS